jgi:hypothetical protein
VSLHDAATALVPQPRRGDPAFHGARTRIIRRRIEK